MCTEFSTEFLISLAGCENFSASGGRICGPYRLMHTQMCFWPKFVRKLPVTSWYPCSAGKITQFSLASFATPVQNWLLNLNDLPYRDLAPNRKFIDAPNSSCWPCELLSSVLTSKSSSLLSSKNWSSSESLASSSSTLFRTLPYLKFTGTCTILEVALIKKFCPVLGHRCLLLHCPLSYWCTQTLRPSCTRFHRHNVCVWSLFENSRGPKP